MKDINQTDYNLLESRNLPIITSIESLAKDLILSKRIIYLLSEENQSFYKKFTISKKDGTKREILSPHYSMKLVQKWILEEILEKVNISKEAMAFRKNFNGILENARIHKSSIYILELDLKDFFATIRRKKVFSLFKSLGYNAYISNIFANLCTYNGYLPQGGVCSPYISNLVSIGLDKRLKGLCSKRDILYTRYADDLTFSCDNKKNLIETYGIIKDIIEDLGFKINNKKTRLLSPRSHKCITGITVNDGHIKASKTLKRKIRALIHCSIMNGDYSNNNQIRGYISYINAIEKNYKEKKIIPYINKFRDKPDLFLDEELVKKFNDNKIYKEIEDFMHIPF